MRLSWTGISIDKHWGRLCVVLSALWSFNIQAEEIPEYMMKAVYLYNFASFIEWPKTQEDTILFCVYGKDPFGNYLDQLKGKKIGGKSISVRLVDNLEQLNDCRVVFISRSFMPELQRVLDELRGKPILTVADMPNAIDEGVVLNMVMRNNRVVFEANLKSAQQNGLDISSKLMRLAIRVIR